LIDLDRTNLVRQQQLGKERVPNFTGVSHAPIPQRQGPKFFGTSNLTQYGKQQPNFEPCLKKLYPV